MSAGDRHSSAINSQNETTTEAQSHHTPQPGQQLTSSPDQLVQPTSQRTQPLQMETLRSTPNTPPTTPLQTPQHSDDNNSNSNNSINSHNSHNTNNNNNDNNDNNDNNNNNNNNNNSNNNNNDNNNNSNSNNGNNNQSPSPSSTSTSRLSTIHTSTTDQIMPNDYEVSIAVPRNAVGFIIGKHGETVRNMIKRSSAHIHVDREDTNPHAPVRIFHIIGTRQSVISAHDLIKEKVFAVLHGKPRGTPCKVTKVKCNLPINDNKETSPSSASKALPSDEIEQINIASSSGEEQNVPPLTAEYFERGIETSPLEMWIPRSCVGMIIGQGGQVINGMQETSGATIVVHNKKMNEQGSKLLTISGGENEKNTAKTLIQSILDRADTMPRRPSNHQTTSNTQTGLPSQPHHHSSRGNPSASSPRNSDHLQSNQPPYNIRAPGTWPYPIIDARLLQQPNLQQFFPNPWFTTTLPYNPGHPPNFMTQNAPQGNQLPFQQQLPQVPFGVTDHQQQAQQQQQQPQTPQQLQQQLQQHIQQHQQHQQQQLQSQQFQNAQQFQQPQQFQQFQQAPPQHQQPTQSIQVTTPPSQPQTPTTIPMQLQMTGFPPLQSSTGTHTQQLMSSQTVLPFLDANQQQQHHHHHQQQQHEIQTSNTYQQLIDQNIPPSQPQTPTTNATPTQTSSETPIQQSHITTPPRQSIAALSYQQQSPAVQMPQPTVAATLQLPPQATSQAQSPHINQ